MATATETGRGLVLKRLAETLREVGLLVFVFGLLDERTRYLEEVAALQQRYVEHPVAVDWPWIATVLGIGVGLIAVGIVIEWLLSS